MVTACVSEDKRDGVGEKKKCISGTGDYAWLSGRGNRPSSFGKGNFMAPWQERACLLLQPKTPKGPNMGRELLAWEVPF